ncbi:MAG TPA: hypothetical protein VGC49_03160 [Solirubrobacterales bacterium]|jgi:hypothetical protein
MPQILIVTDSPHSAGEVVYRERIASADLESAHFSGQLVERVGWAVLDANELEHRARLLPVDPPEGANDPGDTGSPPKI